MVSPMSFHVIFTSTETLWSGRFTFHVQILLFGSKMKGTLPKPAIRISMESGSRFATSERSTEMTGVLVSTAVAGAGNTGCGVLMERLATSGVCDARLRKVIAFLKM